MYCRLEASHETKDLSNTKREVSIFGDETHVRVFIDPDLQKCEPVRDRWYRQLLGSRRVRYRAAQVGGGQWQRRHRTETELSMRSFQLTCPR